MPVLEGADVVFYLVHMMWTGGDFVPVERRAAENARKACEAAGVRRIVYLGGIMPKEKRSRHMEGRAVVGDALREGSIQVIELQAAMIVGPGSAAFEVIRDLVNHLPIMITPKWVRRRSTPIALENVLTYMIAAADLPFEGHRILELAGPDVLTYQEIMDIYGEFVGKKPIVIPVPVLTPSSPATGCTSSPPCHRPRPCRWSRDWRTTTSATTARCASWCRSACSPSASPSP